MTPSKMAASVSIWEAMANKDGASSLLFAVPRFIKRINQWLHKLMAGESIALA
jgi:hypothetical protein